MKISVTLEINDDARRGLSGSTKPATRKEVIEEFEAVWSAHLDDLCERFSYDEATRKSLRRKR